MKDDLSGKNASIFVLRCLREGNRREPNNILKISLNDRTQQSVHTYCWAAGKGEVLLTVTAIHTV